MIARLLVARIWGAAYYFTTVATPAVRLRTWDEGIRADVMVVRLQWPLIPTKLSDFQQAMLLTITD